MMRLMTLLILSAALLVGCAPYVNIPATEGDFLASHSINTATVHVSMVSALKYVLDHHGPPGPPPVYAVKLPPKAGKRTYEYVMNHLPKGGYRAEAAPPGVPVYQVRAIRLRGTRGSVDVVSPASEGKQRLVTVRLRRTLGGWYAEDHTVWNINSTADLPRFLPMSESGSTSLATQ